VAGHDTVAATLAWLYYLVGCNSRVQEKLQAEVKAHVKEALTLADLTKLSYTRLVIDEALRLYPPAWGQPREAIEDDEIDGYFIPKGRIIAVSQYLAQRHPDYWKEPLKFHPERFLAEEELAKEHPKFAYFPFGGGSRMCIGNNFALMEAQIIVAMISQSFTIELASNQTIMPDPTFTLRPDGPVLVKLKKAK
jgi:cytochrome P450